MAIIINPGPDLSANKFYQESLDALDAEKDISLITEVGDKFIAEKGFDATIEDNSVSDEGVRRSKVAFFNPLELGDVFTKISQSISFFNAKEWNFDLTSFVEDWQYTIYDSASKGYYDWHLDLNDTWNSSPRKLSAVIQLSDPSEYEGGELIIKFGSDDQCTQVASKEKGALIIFPSYMLHKVSPVTSGVRKSLVIWVSGPKFR